MNESNILDIPKDYNQLLKKADEIGFNMPSDLYIGSLLKTLLCSKPGGRFLELGTGIGLSLSWMIDGMDENSRLITIDNDPQLIDVNMQFFGHDDRVQILCEDGASWLQQYSGPPFDLIFADAWPGKYSDIEITLDMLKVGGIYGIDDMAVQSNWPDGHQDKVDRLVTYLEQRDDFNITKMSWSTGVVIAVKKYA